MVLVIKHVPNEGPGLFGDMLEGRGIPFTVIEAWHRPLPHTPAGCRAVISMGGNMSVNDGLPFIEREKEFLAQAMAREVPILGVCLGAQVVASMLGSRVYAGPAPEAGWGQIRLTEAGRRDPIFSGVDDEIPVLHWHGETFDLPEGAELLASSEKYERQAFRHGQRIYGFQFHLEATAGMVRQWLEEDAAQGGMVRDVAAVEAGIKGRMGRVHLNAALVFGRFMDRMLRG